MNQEEFQKRKIYWNSLRQKRKLQQSPSQKNTKTPKTSKTLKTKIPKTKIPKTKPLPIPDVLKNIHYGVKTCSGIVKSKNIPCTNFAYYWEPATNKAFCGVHSSKKTRQKLPQDPLKYEKIQAEINRRNKTIEVATLENKKLHKQGHVIVTQLRMMKPPQHKDGYLTVLPNYKHQTRKDGFGCMRLSPKALGPVIHGMPNLPISKTLENFHQFGKIFKFELDENGNVTPESHAYRIKGMKGEPKRHKYPTSVLNKKNDGKRFMEFAAFFDKQGNERRYNYLQSRYFYCHHYELLAKQEPDFKLLREKIKNGCSLNISGYDGYPIEKSTPWKCYNDTSKGHHFGHELVLYSLLVIDNPRDYPWNRFYRENKNLYQDVIKCTSP